MEVATLTVDAMKASAVNLRNFAKLVEVRAEADYIARNTVSKSLDMDRETYLRRRTERLERLFDLATAGYVFGEPSEDASAVEIPFALAGMWGATFWWQRDHSITSHT